MKKIVSIFLVLFSVLTITVSLSEARPYSEHVKYHSKFVDMLADLGFTVETGSGEYRIDAYEDITYFDYCPLQGMIFSISYTDDKLDGIFIYTYENTYAEKHWDRVLALFTLLFDDALETEDAAAEVVELLKNTTSKTSNQTTIQSSEVTIRDGKLSLYCDGDSVPSMSFETTK